MFSPKFKIFNLKLSNFEVKLFRKYKHFIKFDTNGECFFSSKFHQAFSLILTSLESFDSFTEFLKLQAQREQSELSKSSLPYTVQQ